MSNALAERGYDVVAVGIEDKTGEPGFLVHKDVRFLNVGLGHSMKHTLMERIRRFFVWNRKKRHVYDRILRRRKQAALVKPVLEENPDIIICYNAEATLLLKVALDVKIPIITMFHFDPVTILGDLSTQEQEVLKSCECIQVLLPSYVGVTKNYINHDNIVCIGNVAPQLKTIYPLYENKVLINVARFDKLQKRQHLIIEAFNKIKKRFSDWRIEFWGEMNFNKRSVDYVNYCKSLVVKYGLEEQVHFCGTTENVIEKLKEASIFVFPSAYEGLPLAHIEAMSTGLPSIGFKNCPAVNELIKDGSNGILCEETVDAFALGLAELMDDVDKRKQYGLQAKNDMNQYAPENIWDQWEELINKTVYDYKMDNTV